MWELRIFSTKIKNILNGRSDPGLILQKVGYQRKLLHFQGSGLFSSYHSKNHPTFWLRLFKRAVLSAIRQFEPLGFLFDSSDILCSVVCFLASRSASSVDGLYKQAKATAQYPGI